MQTVITYKRRTSDDATETHSVNLDALYHQLFTFMQRLHEEDRFGHQDMLKIASAMDVVKRSINGGNN